MSLLSRFVGWIRGHLVAPDPWVEWDGLPEHQLPVEGLIPIVNESPTLLQVWRVTPPEQGYRMVGASYFLPEAIQAAQRGGPGVYLIQTLNGDCVHRVEVKALRYTA